MCVQMLSVHLHPSSEPEEMGVSGAQTYHAAFPGGEYS